ncbi:hypothetical protein [Bacillus mesophilum]|uniref:Uncharacterized protein n=1 Tax=Bacillus mesophilum TaxID=1071718 RepID=A0A7V7UXE3_9BACI|nr:hypothetical protein [Bacillus mesophilum]KAB2335886.1 hypothetical protein F7732_04815 [Bacillus mesophilum]
MQNEKIPLREIFHIETDEYIPFDDFSSGLMGEEQNNVAPYDSENSQGYIEDVDIAISINAKQLERNTINDADE